MGILEIQSGRDRLQPTSPVFEQSMRTMSALRAAALVVLVAGCARQGDVNDNRGTPLRQPARVGAEGNTRTSAGFHWKADDGVVTLLELAPDDSLLAVCVQPPGEKSVSRIVILNSRNADEVYRCTAAAPRAIGFSPESDRLAVLDGESLTLHDIARREVSFSIDGKTFHPGHRALGFTADGAILISAGEYLDPEVDWTAWNVSTGEVTPVSDDSPVFWHQSGLARDGSKFFRGRWSGPTPRIYRTDRTARITYCYRSPWPTAAAFTPDSKNLVTAHEDGILVLWEIVTTAYDENARQMSSCPGFDECRVLAIAHDRQRIAVATEDGSVEMRPLPLDHSNQ